MPISALSLKFYNITYFSFNFEKKNIHTKAHLDQNFLPTYMSSLDATLP